MNIALNGRTLALTEETQLTDPTDSALPTPKLWRGGRTGCHDDSALCVHQLLAHRRDLLIAGAGSLGGTFSHSTVETLSTTEVETIVRATLNVTPPLKRGVVQEEPAGPCAGQSTDQIVVDEKAEPDPLLGEPGCAHCHCGV
jgi:hypothetical protein